MWLVQLLVQGPAACKSSVPRRLMLLECIYACRGPARCFRSSCWFMSELLHPVAGAQVRHRAPVAGIMAGQEALPRIDHIIIGAQDLKAAVDHFYNEYGLAASHGGKHQVGRSLYALVCSAMSCVTTPNVACTICGIEVYVGHACAPL